MTISLSVILFIALILMLQIIGEVFTILFMLTGLPERKARFQVVSLLTTSGYTTKESELIIENNRRRQLAKITMLFGYTFTATFVSIFVNVLINIGQKNFGDFWSVGLIASSVMVIVLLLFRIRKVREVIDKMIMRITNKLIFGKHKNYLIVLDDYGDSCIAEVKLHTLPNRLKDKRIEELPVKTKFGIQILVILRDGEVINKVTKDEILQVDDVVTLYGPYAKIKKYFIVDETDDEEFDEESHEKSAE